MGKLAVMFHIDHFSRRDVVKEFSGRDRGDILEAAEGIVFDREDYDPDEHVKIYTLEELAAMFNDQMLDDQGWWLVITEEAAVDTEELLPFQNIKDEVHDISGVKDPDGWLYKKHGGVWYPWGQK